MAAAPCGAAVRLLQERDIDTVLRIQAACYEQGYLEPAEAFAAKLRGSRTTCWIAEAGCEAVAYLIALPVDDTTFPVLHATTWQAPAQPRWLYLHDMAVLPAARAMGWGRQLLIKAHEQAQHMGCLKMALIAVQGSVPYWQKQGFVLASSCPPSLAPKISSFGPDARLMLSQAG